MLCENCGKNQVNFRYTQIINGVKKEMALCDKCAKILGLDGLDFNMPINFSSFLGDFLNLEKDTDFLPNFTKQSLIKCNNCGMTYNEFVDKGKVGCINCYDVFSNILKPVLKNIHGSTSHIGRNAKLTSKNKVNITEKVQEKKKNDNISKLEKLELDLKQAIKDERYEEAAKIRDEIKKLSK